MGKASKTASSYEPRRTFDKGTLTDRVYQNLREDILSNRLLPETPLHEASIASALEVSRGPVREALRRLDAEGLVSVIPRRGAVVSSLSREEFLDAYRVRESLEVLAVRLATPNLTQEDLDQLYRLHEEMLNHASAEDVDGFFETNTAFHATVVDRSDNKILQGIYHPLINQMRRYRVSSMSLRGGLTRSCEEHAQILQAMKEGEAEQAAQLLRAHIQVPLRTLENDHEAILVPRLQSTDQDDYVEGMLP
jgi:DNA-binding GntR family transcriptional regulator